MVDKVYCVLCGVMTNHPVTTMINGQPFNFCCVGCARVYEFLQEEKMLQSGQNGEGTQPPQQAEPLQPVVIPPAGSAPSYTITLPVLGMCCANCVWLAERSLRAVPGVLKVKVSLASSQAVVEIMQGVATAAHLRQAVEQAGFESPVGDI